MMTWTEFRNRFSIQLNQQQESAVQSVEGPVLLLAVPGSGKTTVLVTRLGYMIFCKGIAPERIGDLYGGGDEGHGGALRMPLRSGDGRAPRVPHH